MTEEIRRYFRERNAKAGRAKSAKKAAASRENGKKGGRPRKTENDNA